MLSTIIARAASPTLAWHAGEPGLLAILVQALREPVRAGRHVPPAPAPFTWL